MTVFATKGSLIISDDFDADGEEIDFAATWSGRDNGPADPATCQLAPWAPRRVVPSGWS